jgi:HEPN domain-containing protein
MQPEWSEIKRWLEKADHDRRMAEAGLTQTPPITDGAAFHCQQAAEKLLKAYLVYCGESFEKVHDLGALAHACARHEPEFANLVPRVLPLNPFAVRFRYPGTFDPTVQQVRDALKVVQDVLGFVLKHLPPDVHS